MKSLTARAGLAAATLLLIGAAADSELPKPLGQPVISGVVVEGEAVLLTVQFPAGFARAVLETRASLESAWQEGPELAVSAAGGDAQFRLSKPGDILFMRIRAVYSGGEMNSSQLNYLTLAAAGALESENESPDRTRTRPVASLHFKSFIDGLDTIRIEHGGILWKHLGYKWPQDVSLNGRTWKPVELNFIAFKPDLAGNNISWPASRIEVIKARDIMALEKEDDHAVVHVYDTPWGASEYEFKVHLLPATTTVASQGGPARLRIRADIDGSDQLIVNAKEARWEHKHWKWPANVEMNGASWNPKESAAMEMQPRLPAGIDFRTARLVSKTGRGFANVEAREKDIVVSFADDFDGAATYDLEIAFGQ